jgi:predicted O-methyltransferase YrrM
LTGIFSKNPDAVGRPILKRRSQTQNAEPIAADPEFDRVSGNARSRDVLLMIHEVAKPRFYLEIGVRRGGSLALARCPTVAVDPEPSLSHAVGPHVSLFETTSDLFFEFEAASALKTRPDLIFIDGMHLFEFALRDFMNAERHAHAGTILLIDDILPNHPRQASRERQTRVWTGDVWKIEHCLTTHRPDLHLIRLDTSPAGLLLVLGLNPTAVRLWERYNAILRDYQGPEYLDTPQAVLDRHAAHDPNSAALRDLVSSVATARNPKTATQLVTTAVREFHAKSPGLG